MAATLKPRPSKNFERNIVFLSKLLEFKCPSYTVLARLYTHQKKSFVASRTKSRMTAKSLATFPNNDPKKHVVAFLFFAGGKMWGGGAV